MPRGGSIFTWQPSPAIPRSLRAQRDRPRSQSRPESGKPASHVMSGIEVLGAFASAAQVAAYMLKFTTLLTHVYERLQHAPARVARHGEQIQRLIDITLLIRENPSLHTKIILRHLESTLAQATSLQTLLDKLLVQYTQHSSLRRYWRALTSSKEDQVLEALQDLEREKTGLSLCLAASQTQNNVGRQARMSDSDDTIEITRTESPNVGRTRAPPSNAVTFLNIDSIKDSNKQVGFPKITKPEATHEEIKDDKGQTTAVRNANMTSDSNSFQFNGSNVAGCVVNNKDAASSDKSTQHNGIIGKDGKITNRSANSTKDSVQVNGIVDTVKGLDDLLELHRRHHGGG